MAAPPGVVFDPASALNRLRACTRPEDKLRGYFHWLGFRKERGDEPPRPWQSGGKPSFLVFRAGAPEKPLSADLEIALLPDGGERQLAFHFRLRHSRDYPRQEVACRVYLLDEAVLDRLGKRLHSGLPGAEGSYPAAGGLHPGEVLALAALPDGRLASWGEGTLRLSDPDTGAVHTLARHPGPVVALAALRDGRLASGDADGSIRLWDLGTGSARPIAPHPGPLAALAVLPDGRLASGGKEGRIRLWQPATGGVQTLELRRAVAALAALPDGRLVSSDGSGMTQIWDPVTGAAETFGSRGWGRVRTVLPDGRLVCQEKGDRVRLWDPVTRGDQSVDLPEPGRVLAALPDGRLVLGDGGAVRVAALPAAAGARPAPAFLPAIFRDDFLSRDFEAVRILSAIPELEGKVDARGHGRLGGVAVPGGEPAATLDDLCGRLFFAVVIDQ
jgi:hypothetical protein